MTVTFSPEIEAGIAQQAEQRGIAPQELVREIVVREITPSAPPEPLHLDVDGFLTELERIGTNLPALPERSFLRESFYEDHR